MALIYCRHCHRRHCCRPRGLCRQCYERHDLRQRYPSLLAGCPIVPGYGITNGPRALPEPTTTLPGEAKVSVLCERAAAEKQLWHPNDARPELED